MSWTYKFLEAAYRNRSLNIVKSPVILAYFRLTERDRDHTNGSQARSMLIAATQSTQGERSRGRRSRGYIRTIALVHTIGRSTAMLMWCVEQASPSARRQPRILLPTPPPAKCRRGERVTSAHKRTDRNSMCCDDSTIDGGTDSSRWMKAAR
jgi:hypothetical protein